MTLRNHIFGTRLTPAADIGLLLGRLIMGFSLLLAHGIGKVPPDPGFATRVGEMGFPAPMLFAWLAAIAETVGAFLIAIGLLTRPAALYVTGHFMFVVLVAHSGDSFSDRERAFLFMTFALIFLFTGAGRFSVDALLDREPRT